MSIEEIKKIFQSFCYVFFKFFIKCLGCGQSSVTIYQYTLNINKQSELFTYRCILSRRGWQMAFLAGST